jgi:acyl-coenzyme A synthetase/AMP-(fatty) acid ligase
MVELLPLRQWLTAQAPLTMPVARRGAALLTRADVLACAGAWATALQRHPERDCAVYMRDGFEFISILFGAWQAGKTVWLPGDVQPGTCARLRESVSLFIGEFAEPSVMTAPDDAAATFSFSALEPEQPALIVYTSGSTGTPAAIPKTLRQLDAEVAAMQVQWGALVGQAQVIASVPHQHFYGLLFKIFWPICRGAVFESFSLDYPEQVCASLVRADTVWIGSPALLRRLPTDLDWPTNNLRALFCSGGPLPLEAARQCAQLFGQWPREVYGSSETGALAGRTQEHAPAFWQPLPGVSVQRELATGQLEVHTPWLPDATPWLMADRGEVQADGSFSLLGRADRIVKVVEKSIS